MPGTELTCDIVHTAILAVLAGIDSRTAANNHGLDVGDLHEALCLYQHAGRAALAAFIDPWHQVRLQFADPENAELALTTVIGPQLNEMADGWWFIRKHPQWRIRIAKRSRHLAEAAVQPLLDDLVARGLLRSWRPGIYEPETPAFGGQAGMDIAHALFTADTAGILTYLRQPEPALGRREVSVALATVLLRGAGLEWFEQGHVWHMVAALRPLPDDVRPEDITRLAHQVGILLYANSNGLNALVATTPAWPEAFETAGRDLHAADLQGNLDRGLRQICAHHVIFHWNRIGLPPRTQSLLAHAAAQAILRSVDDDLGQYQ